MKTFNFIIIICAISFFSCKKPNQTEHIINNNCIDNSLSAYYLDFWKKEFLIRNTMSEEYFNSHISQISVSSHCWNSGITFRVEYKVRIDWAVIQNYDEFLVKLYSSEPAYQYLNIQRDSFFNSDQLNEIIDLKIMNSAIGPVKSLDCLLQNNSINAIHAFQDSTNSIYIFPKQISYEVPGKFPRKDGYPYFIGYGIINQNANQCIQGYYNLYTGEFFAHEDPCIISY